MAAGHSLTGLFPNGWLVHGRLLVAGSLKFKAAATAMARRAARAACYHDSGQRDLNLLERVEHILGGATDARQDVIFEVPRARRGLAGKAKWFVDDWRWKRVPFHDVLHPVCTPHATGQMHIYCLEGGQFCPQPAFSRPSGSLEDPRRPGGPPHIKKLHRKTSCGGVCPGRPPVSGRSGLERSRQPSVGRRPPR
jgi:hypothetical protein